MTTPTMEQTITPEERGRRVELAKGLSAAVRTEAESLMLKADTISKARGIEYGAAYSTIDFLIDELDRVRQEALAQGWDEAVDYAGNYLGVTMSAALVFAERNPHRSHE